MPDASHCTRGLSKLRELGAHHVELAPGILELRAVLLDDLGLGLREVTRVRKLLLELRDVLLELLFLLREAGALAFDVGKNIGSGMTQGQQGGLMSRSQIDISAFRLGSAGTLEPQKIGTTAKPTDDM